MTDRIDISNDLNDTFFTDPQIKKGKVLGFKQNGTLNHYKIVRLNRKKKVCQVIPYNVYSEQELKDMPQEKVEELIEKGGN